VVFATVAGSIVAVALMLPLAWKWQLGLRRVGIGLAFLAVAAVALALAVDAVVGLPVLAQAGLACAVTVGGAFAILAYRFYRDPEREPPAGDHLIVSPADGEIVYVMRSEGGRLPVSTKRGSDVQLQELTRTSVHEEDSIVVGIGMSFLDVHVNRAPIAGKVSLRKHYAGRFGSLGNREMVFENERATTVITGHTFQIAVVQIASRLVRQIVGFVRVGQDVELGQRIGIIRFGSQVDVVLPSRADLRVVVTAGDRVHAGTSVIARLGEAGDDGST
jgi:phosphatidylserine decarboxylase